MISFKLNGQRVTAEPGATILETARFFGVPIPTLCDMEGLTPFGGCRLCVVEIGDGEASKLVTACTHPVQEGMRVRTASRRVVDARRMVAELLLASCPQSKTVQDLAASMGIHRQRFRQEHEDCILCGRCVRMCSEQMMSGAIGFQGRGRERRISTPFDRASELCRRCGGCIQVCPACELRCTFNEPERAVCGGCANLSPPCVDHGQFDDMQCYMDPCAACRMSGA
ncbi:MAG: (2Fe-2S)-binding protein [Candidatus Wallbacteria bacterium]|nr:(2Fe-2S)-binding protein [Candidatus Wallbacteria bacterium]